METKIARLMTEVNSPMKVYEMTPEYYGAALIAVTTGKEFLNSLRQQGKSTEEYMEAMKGNEYRSLILPGIDMGAGVAIMTEMGHFIDNSIEESLNEEGYVIIDLGISD